MGSLVLGFSRVGKPDISVGISIRWELDGILERHSCSVWILKELRTVCGCSGLAPSPTFA